MRAEQIILEFTDLTAEQNRKLSLSIRSCRFTNSITSLTPNIEIICNPFYFNFIIPVQNEISYKKPSVKINVSKNNKIFTLAKGYVLRIEKVVENSEHLLSLTVVANTYDIFLQGMKPFEIFTTVSAKTLIQNILKDNNLDKTYDQIIFPEVMSSIDGESYSSTGQQVYNYLENILNDLQIKLFTTCYKIGANDQQILYFYDTGKYAESVITYEQTLTNINVLKYQTSIDYSFFPDKIQIESEQGFNDTSFATEKIINTKDLKSLGFNKINQRKNINLPEILLTKKIKSRSTDIDSSNYAVAVLRDSVFNGISIQVQTNSIFTDLFDNNKGIWALGKKIAIENAMLKSEFQNMFEIYLQNSEKYYFVLSAIDYIYENNAISCYLTITPNDLIFLK